MFHGILNSLIISGLTAAICTYFSALTAYGLYVYDFKLKSCFYIYFGDFGYAYTSHFNGFLALNH